MLAVVQLSTVPSFIQAYRLLQREGQMADTTPVTDAVNKAFDEVADEVLKQVYGVSYLQKFTRQA